MIECCARRLILVTSHSSVTKSFRYLIIRYLKRQSPPTYGRGYLASLCSTYFLTKCSFLFAPCCRLLLVGLWLCICCRFEFCPMPLTHSSFLSLFCASFVNAQFDLCSMPHTNPSLDDTIWASCTATWFNCCPMLRAHSSFLSLIWASFTTASFLLCSMPSTHSSSHGNIWASCTAT